MTHPQPTLVDFQKLYPTNCVKSWQALINANTSINLAPKNIKTHAQFVEFHKHQFLNLDINNSDSAEEIEYTQTQWLIGLFNELFKKYNTVLVRGEHEPEYIAADANTPAKIIFAHGFFASALHEASHWCIAGKKRRQQDDFGYWYAPDGRDEAQQAAFEKVEIKPQAIECLLTLACKRKFGVSQDNLFAEFDTSGSTFEQDVYQQATSYLTNPTTLPKDALMLITTLYLINFG